MFGRRGDPEAGVPELWWPRQAAWRAGGEMYGGAGRERAPGTEVFRAGEVQGGGADGVRHVPLQCG